MRDLLPSLHGTLELHHAAHVVVSRDTLETWGHLASAALLLRPHHASPEDGLPPFGCMLAVLASLFVLVSSWCSWWATCSGAHPNCGGVPVRVPPLEPMMIPRAEQIAEAQRVLALRQKVFPQWIKSGKLDAGEAHDQLRAMEAIVKTLMRLDAEQRQLSLCTTPPEDPA